jgi:hypothetical protein
MRKILLAIVLTLAAPAAAHATILYSTMELPNDVQGTNSDSADTVNWLAQSFTPTTSGTARVASFYAQTQSGLGFGTGTIAIYSDSGGKPGTQLAAGTGTVGEITGASPTCTVLGSTPSLVKGTTYWAVFSGNKTMSWLFSRNAAMSGLFSTNSGATWASRAEKTFSLRVEDVPTCGPVINPNPAVGTSVANMYIKPGASTFNTIFIGNSGNQTLTLTGASFGGTGASSFRLLQGDPNGPQNQPFTFPYTIGASAQAGVLLYVACTGALPAGTRTATLTLSSNDPAHPLVSWPVACVVDNTPPSIQFSQPAGTVNGWQNKLPASLTVTGIDPESNNSVVDIKCSVNGGATLDFPNGATATLSFNTSGTENVSCRATDVAGNTSGAYTTTVKIDTVPPVISGRSTQPSPTNHTSATFTWTQSDTLSGVQGAHCQLDSGSITSCQSGVTVSNLADGQHNFAVHITDFAGNVSAVAVWTWIVDTVPPNTALSGGPGSLTNQHAATFGASGAGTGGKYLCSLDNATATTCSATIDYENIPDGHHTLRVWAVDAAGNQDPTPASASWTIDSVAPTAQITGNPDSATTVTTASFTFISTNAGDAPFASFQCSVDGGAYTTCTSPFGIAGLSVRQHTLAVRAVDTLGNVQTPATTFSWMVDAPAGLALSAPAFGTAGSEILTSSLSAALSAGASPAGTITFEVFGPQSSAPTDCSSGGTTVGTASASGDGTYHPSAAFTPTAAGDYWWYASYDGNADNNPASSACGASMAETIVASTSPNLSLSAPASGTAGSAISASAVSASIGGGSAATGTITFKVFGPQSSAPTSCTQNGTTAGTATVSGDGTYHPSAAFTPAAPGRYWWYASYGGDPNNGPASSACGVSMPVMTVAAGTPPAPVNRVAPQLVGTAAPGATVTCDKGTWTNSPVRYVYAWMLDGHAITGAHASRYLVSLGDQNHRLACSVIASNPGGVSHPALSRPTTVAACAPAGGGLSLPASRVGALRLGMSLTSAERQLPGHAVHGSWVQFRSCIGAGIRAGVPSQKMLAVLTARKRPLYAGRITIVLTANRLYKLNGVSAGQKIKATVSRLHATGPFKVGRATWYLIPARSADGVLRVRGGKILEVGIADRTLVGTGRASRQTFFKYLGS